MTVFREEIYSAGLKGVGIVKDRKFSRAFSSNRNEEVPLRPPSFYQNSIDRKIFERLYLLPFRNIPGYSIVEKRILLED